MNVRRTAFTLFLVLVLPLAGCLSVDDPSAAIASDAPALSQAESSGSANSQDQADHDCQVVLRYTSIYPAGADPKLDCSTGECLYIWEGAVEVADSVDPGAEVRILYHLSSDPTWWEIPATFVENVPAFRRYAFNLSAHLLGPDTPNRDSLAVELVAFLGFPDGRRLFDHNLHQGDFENARLESSSFFAFSDGGTCAPEATSIWFSSDWGHSTSGPLRQGAYLDVHYDISRLPECRGTHNGFPAWDVVAYAKFLPGGQMFSGSVRRLGNDNGTPTNEATDQAFIVQIPEDAESVQLWFQNTSGAGNNCQAWDSNYGSNYAFEVWPPTSDPRCQGIEKESGMHAEDDRMAHNQPVCLPYTLASQFDATNCEFYLDGFGDGFVGHYGIPFHWVFAQLRVGPQQGEVLNVGLFTRFHDLDNGQTGQRFSLGIQEADGRWRAGTVTYSYSTRGNLQIDTFAFFLDVRRPSGEVVRLWQSRLGADYLWSDAFGLPTVNEYIPYGNIQWANPDSGVYDSRRACR